MSVSYPATATYPSSNPLSNIVFSMRLQTHVPGSNTPLGLYKDTACTIPATLEGDAVAGWRDELSSSGIVATQSTAGFRPLLHFDNGKPVLLFDGVDDFLSYSPSINLVGGLPVSVFATANKLASSSYESLIGFLNTFFAYIQLNAANWGIYNGANQDAGQSVSGTYSVLSIETSGAINETRFWTNGINAVVSGTYQEQPGSASQIGSDGNPGRYLSGGIVSLMAVGSIVDTTTRQLIESYSASLTP